MKAGESKLIGGVPHYRMVCRRCGAACWAPRGISNRWQDRYTCDDCLPVSLARRERTDPPHLRGVDDEEVAGE